MTAAKRLAAAIKADPTLAERLLVVAEPRGPLSEPLTTALAAYRAVLPLLAGRSTEALACVAVNRRLRVLSAELLTTGSDSFCIVDARQILRWALLQGRSGAHAIVLAHNHPSGDASPSQQDRDVTLRVARAASAVGIKMLDHLVVTDTSYTSFAERGELPSWES